MTRSRHQGAGLLYLKESIAFYPTLIAVGLLSLAILTAYLEILGATEYLHERVPYLIVTNGDVTRAILTTIVVGMISLTVFSFTMVMQVLSRASASFSPRVLPGLITHRSNQKILGFYLGVIIYGLAIMMTERAGAIGIPGLGTLFSVLLAIASLSLFVHFIHSISTSIQVESILEGLSQTTRRQLGKLEDRQDPRYKAALEGKQWRNIPSDRWGFVQEIREKQAIVLLNRHDACMRMLVPLGSYVVRNSYFFQTSRELDEATRRLMMKAFVFHTGEEADINYVQGLLQITEIAVAALSAGRNDHGTAIRAMALLSDLLAERMHLADEEYIPNDKGELRIVVVWPSFDDLLHMCLGPIRNHAGRDTAVYLKLLEVIRTLLLLNGDRSKQGLLIAHGSLVVQDAARASTNSGDVIRINAGIAAINAQTDSPEFQLEDISLS